MMALNLLRPHAQIRDLGSGNFGVAKLMRDRQTNELVGVKFIERGDRVRRKVLMHVQHRLWATERRAETNWPLHADR
jgi:hypothetical protein